MGIFNNKVQKKHYKIIFRRTPTYHLTYQRKTTDSGLSKWLEDSSQNRFHLDVGKVTILNDCALIVIVDGIKQKIGLGVLILKVDGHIIQSYSEDTNKKSYLSRLTYSVKFKKGTMISIEFNNVTDI